MENQVYLFNKNAQKKNENGFREISLKFKLINIDPVKFILATPLAMEKNMMMLQDAGSLLATNGRSKFNEKEYPTRIQEIRKTIKNKIGELSKEEIVNYETNFKFNLSFLRN